MTANESPDNDKAFADGLRLAQKLAGKGEAKRAVEAQLVEQGFEKLIAYRIVNQVFDQAAIDSQKRLDKKAAIKRTFLDLLGDFLINVGHWFK